MPTYRINIGGSTYRVNSDREMTDAQAYEIAAGQHEDYTQKHGTAVAADQQATRERHAEGEKKEPLGQRILTNVGAGFNRLKQAVTFADKADVQEHEKYRHQAAETMPGGEYVQMAAEVAPTMLIPAGAAGSVLTRAVPRLGGRLAGAIGGRAANVANVAGTGAGMAAITTPGDIGDRAMGAAMAGGFGAALPASVAAAQAGRRAVTQRGGERAVGERLLQEIGPQRADDMIGALTQHGPTQQTLAGVQRPTAAQLTGDPVLRELEVGARTKQPAMFAAGDDAAAQGRYNALHDIAKTPQELTAAEAARTAATSPMRDAALSAAERSQGFERPVMQAAIDMAEGGSRTNPAVQKMTSYVMGELERGVTPEQLYTIRKTLTSGVPHGTELGAAISQSRAERMKLVEAIDQALDASTGGQWSPYLQRYQQMSQPVTSMRAGQAIERDFGTAARTTQAGDPILTASKLRRAIQARGEKQFGGRTLPRVTEGERARLGAIADSAEAQTAASMSQGLEGSRTAGNVASGENMARVSKGIGALVGGVPGAAIGHVLPKWHGKKSEEILARLLQDPEQLAHMIEKAKMAQRATEAIGETARVTRAGGELME